MRSRARTTPLTKLSSPEPGDPPPALLGYRTSNREGGSQRRIEVTVFRVRLDAKSVERLAEKAAGARGKHDVEDFGV